jgi:hypothetical protein
MGTKYIRRKFVSPKRISEKVYRQQNVPTTKTKSIGRQNISAQNVLADKMYRQTKHVNGHSILTPNVSTDKKHLGMFSSTIPKCIGMEKKVSGNIFMYYPKMYKGGRKSLRAEKGFMSMSAAIVSSNKM